jgi:hypothetical protein
MDINKLIEKGEIVVEPIVEQCNLYTKTIKVNNEDKVMEQGPCSRIKDGKCSAYISPQNKWRLGDCNLATHIIQGDDVKKFINPIKASKRGR